MNKPVRPLHEFPDLVRTGNETDRPFPRDATVIDFLDLAAEHYPDRPALRTTTHIAETHASLRAHSMRLASSLATCGVGSGTPVGVLLEHEPDAVAAIIAIVRAGGFYVPLDPRWSVARTREVLASLNVIVLIVSAGLARRGFEVGFGIPGLTSVVCGDGLESGSSDDDMTAAAELWNGIATSPDEGAAAGFNLDRRGYRFSLQQIHDYADYVADLVLDHCSPGGAVVELGAGSGLVARRIAARGTSVLAVDPAASAMARLAERAHQDGVPITTAVYAAHEIAHLSGALGEATTVLLSSTVQYFPSVRYLRGILYYLLGALPPGARIVLADLIDPISGQFPGGLRLPRAWWTDWAAGYRALDLQFLPPRTENELNSPLRHRYDVVVSVPSVVPERMPEAKHGGAERPWRWTELPSGQPDGSVSATNLAYTITTSGSTGTAKAVAIRHRSVVNLIDWVNRRNGVTSTDLLLQTAALTFDLSVYDIFGVLSAGGALLLLPDRDLADPDLVLDALLGHEVTLWNSAPAALSMLLPLLRLRPVQGRETLRRVLLSGDWVPLSMHGDLVREFPKAALVALGGATEACVWSNDFLVTGVDPTWTSIPYGHPMQNARYYVLRADGSPAAVGEPGELHIAGECVAAGYVNDSELTTARFLPDPWSADPEARMYRTGDRARWTASGWVEFLGRLDQQIKVRGFRIELGEIEQAAQRLSGVSEAVAVAIGPAREPEIGVVIRSTELSVQDVNEHLLRCLPDYMLPCRLRIVAALPVSPSGKVDRRAVARLLLTEPGSPEGRSVAVPTEALRVLCHAFSELLGVDEVHPDADFFEMGGNSLGAVRLTAHLRARHGLAIGGTDVFDHPSPRGLLAKLTAYDEQ